MQDFSGGGGNFKISGILDIHAAKLGEFGGMPPKKSFENGAISCVLRAIFNHFHDKKSPQKIINKHDPFIMLLILKTVVCYIETIRRCK